MAAPLLILCFLTTSLSSAVVQSPGVVTASVGDSFTLKCSRDELISYCYSSISWFKVNPRSGKVEDIRNEKLDQLDHDQKTCTRTIQNAKVQDSGLFYCTSINNKLVSIGNGTRVIITDKGPLNVSVVVYTPLDVDTPSVLLQCVVLDAVPSQIRILWLIDGDERTGWTESGWTGPDDSASQYTRAQITIPAEEWREASHLIECLVQYGDTNVSRILQRQSHSGSTAVTWLVDGSCGVFILILILIFAAMTLCARKEKLNTHWMIREKCSSMTEVEYSSATEPDGHGGAMAECWLVF